MTKILKLNITDSTNLQLRCLAKEGVPHGFVVFANEQTCGKGRYDRTFVSPKDAGIYMSYLMRTNADIADITSITAYTAVAVKRAIQKACGLKVDIKWVNDLLSNGKKLCGILCESAVKDSKAEYIIIGIGINVNTQINELGEELLDIATSIKEQTGKTVNRKKLLREIIKQLNIMCKQYKKGAKSYFDEYKNSCINIGREIKACVNGESVCGRCVDIDNAFALIIQLPDGSKKTVLSGEASIIKK